MEDKYDKYYAMAKGKAVYPYIIVEDATDELGLILSGLPEGNLQIAYIDENDKIISVRKTEKTPLILNRLLRLYKLRIVLDRDKFVIVSNINELLEVDEFIWTD